MDLADVYFVAGLTILAVKAGAGVGGFVSGWITVMSQFILTTTNLSHNGRPRMAGPWVSATYQKEFTL